MKQDKILPPVLEKYITEAKKFRITDMRYVPSQMNYADVATRGAEVSTLESMEWWTGPKWLRSEADWPHESSSETADDHQIVALHCTVSYKKEILLEENTQGVATLKIMNFSTLPNLLRRTAFCFRALTKFRKKNFLQLQSNLDTATALQWWIYWDQSRCYALSTEPEAGQKFHLNNIAVFRDADGIIRCQTRITNSINEIDTTNPILLVKWSTLTKLIILHHHQQCMHAGTSHTLANLRKSYWLPHGRREVYSVIHQNCFQCKRHIAENYPNPPPAPLPEFRVTRVKKPFQCIGLDICGPFYTRAILGKGQPKIKRWIILFTCAVIRAVHLELLNDMTTTEILLAFRRFCARRGVPATVISDNAPQFHVLDGCFKNIWHDLSQSEAISAYFATQKINWQFIPQLSPWMGGMYERLIQSIKTALEKTYGNIILLDRQFETTMIEIEGVINSRPISYVDREPDSPIVSPNDFLTATHIAIPMQDNLRNEDDLLKKLWRSSQTYLNEFWKHWANHYLLLLRERNDQFKNSRRAANKDPQKGDVVVMVDTTKKRSAWQIAVVERLIRGNDGKIRAAQIKIPNGTRLIRPVVLLAPLNLTMDLPNVRDDQLNRDRDALIRSLPEDATLSLDEENANNNESGSEEEEERQMQTTQEEEDS